MYRYMSTTHSAPSGPVRACTGRHHRSSEAKKIELPLGRVATELEKLTPSSVSSVMLHQIVEGLAGEAVRNPASTRTKQLVPIHHRRAGRGVTARLREAVKALLRRLRRKDLRIARRQRSSSASRTRRPDCAAGTDPRSRSATSDSCSAPRTNSPSRRGRARTATVPTLAISSPVSGRILKSRLPTSYEASQLCERIITLPP